MALIKRLSRNTSKNGVTSDLEILIYENKIIWYYAEQFKNRDGDEFTEDQSYEDYIKNGPPEFASGLTADIIKEIDILIRQR